MDLSSWLLAVQKAARHQATQLLFRVFVVFLFFFFFFSVCVGLFKGILWVCFMGFRLLRVPKEFGVLRVLGFLGYFGL